VPKNRTSRSFGEELPELLKARGLSLRALARTVGVGDDHLSRVVRGARSKRATGELTRRVAVALKLPEDYFAEFRESFVIDEVHRDPNLRDSLYDGLRKGRTKT
jgi:transcriptional regulator with XRE-family HTH domain